MEKKSNEDFRDKPLNIDDSGKSKRIIAKKPKGKWYNRRTVFAWFCILFLVLAPIIKINGNPLMLLDIVNRKFSLFGNMFYPQDTFILALIMLVIVVFIVLFTVVYGRLFCGWACPQTIFLEMVYRRIEFLFEGNHRNKSKENYDNFSLTMRRLGKHIAFIIISFLITNVFIMWFTGPEKLWQIISSPISENQLGFIFMVGVSLFYYVVYAFLRQQICTFFCPYGRLQGVLLDSKSISVIYDFKRGEPRGSKNEGDCIDCGQCIAVCPTGIDIRNGSQFECVNCTACIDECNIVMRKVKKQGNLIRFDSYHGIETGKHSVKNARTYAYSAVLLILVFVLGITISKRSSVDVSVNRMQGTMCQEIDSVTVSNIYTVKLINKTNKNMNLSFELLDVSNADLQFTNDISKLEAGASAESVLMLKLSKSILTGHTTDFKIGVYDGKELISTNSINFIGTTN